MRLADQVRIGNITKNISDNYWRMGELQEKISSGSSLLKPSADPRGYSRSLELQEALSRIDAYETSIRDFTARLTSYEDQVDNLTTNIRNLRQIVLSASNSATQTQVKDSNVDEVNSVIDSMINIANSNAAGGYMFSGSKIDTKPFTVQRDSSQVTGVVYNGDAGEITVSITSEEKIRINLSGEVVFGGRAGRDEDLFQRAIDVRNQIENGDMDGLNESLGKIDNILDNLLAKRMEIGVNMKHIEGVGELHDALKLDFEKENSAIQDVDLPGTISKLLNQEMVYKASLEIAARAQRISLLDFI